MRPFLFQCMKKKRKKNSIKNRFGVSRALWLVYHGDKIAEWTALLFQHKEFGMLTAWCVFDYEQKICTPLFLNTTQTHTHTKNQFDLIKRSNKGPYHMIWWVRMCSASDWHMFRLGSRYWNSMDISTGHKAHFLIISSKAEKRKCDKTFCQCHRTCWSPQFEFNVLSCSMMC